MTTIKHLTKAKYVTLLLVCIFIFPIILRANTNLEQTISLQPGWNAVFIKVQIEETDMNKIFENTSIKKVITYYPRHSSVQFIQDPDSIEWNKNTWLRWVSTEYPDAFLNNLYRLYANRSYLLYSKESFMWKIQGKPVFEIKKWQPESFNFTGFHVAPDAQMTFTDYFGNSQAHIDLNIYKLQNNKWKRINKPENEFIQPNSSYWVFCKGGSKYSGGLKVIFPGIKNLLEYPLHNDEITIEVKNESDQNLSFNISKLDNNPVPLSLKKLNEKYESIYEPFKQYVSKNELKPGESEKITFVVRRNEILVNESKGLLKIFDDLGNQYFLTVWAKGL